MSDRTFPVESVDTGCGRTNAFRIECHKCGKSGHYVLPKSRGVSPHAAIKQFRRYGWKIGRGPRADICDDCNRKGKPKLEIVKPVEQTKAEPPREMSREERRIVFSKIDEVYLDDKGGYEPPWTDAAISRDLGVPKAWVAQVRDELFGPEGSNEEYDSFLEKSAPIIAEMKNLFNAAREQLEQAKALSEKFNKIEPRIQEIERSAGKITREITPVRKVR